MTTRSADHLFAANFLDDRKKTADFLARPAAGTK